MANTTEDVLVIVRVLNSRCSISPLTSQAISVLLRNQLYAGIVDVTEYGVRGKVATSSP